MKFGTHLRGGVLAATIAVAASLGGAAPAQAQEEGWEVCVDNRTPRCVTVPLCVGSVCVSGVPENVDAIMETISNAVIFVWGKIPEQVCTPPLPRQPICINH